MTDLLGVDFCFSLLGVTIWDDFCCLGVTIFRCCICFISCIDGKSCISLSWIVCFKDFEICNCFFSVNALICNDDDDDGIVFSDDLFDVVTFVSPSWIYAVPLWSYFVVIGSFHILMANPLVLFCLEF